MFSVLYLVRVKMYWFHKLNIYVSQTTHFSLSKLSQMVFEGFQNVFMRRIQNYCFALTVTVIHTQNLQSYHINYITDKLRNIKLD